jgi:glucokinase
MAPTIILSADIGGTRTKYGLVDLESGQIISLLTRPTVTSGLDDLAQGLDEAASELCRRADLGRGRVRAAGIGIPGYVDGDYISLVWPSMSFLEGSQFCSRAEEQLGMPIRMDNDARIIALAEAHFGVRGHAPRLLSLALGTGVGFGFVVDGQLQEKMSINHMAGHIMIRPGARGCYCGLSGCLESLVSGPALVETFREMLAGEPANPDIGPDVKAILDAAAVGHPQAVRAVQQMIEDLTMGLNVYINLFAPDAIVLGGGLSRSLRRYLPLIRSQLVAKPFAAYTIRLLISRLGTRAGVYGAASLWEEQAGNQHD